jgi:hypothetical protein
MRSYQTSNETTRIEPENHRSAHPMVIVHRQSCATLRRSGEFKMALFRKFFVTRTPESLVSPPKLITGNPLFNASTRSLTLFWSDSDGSRDGGCPKLELLAPGTTTGVVLVGSYSEIILLPHPPLISFFNMIRV